MTQQRKKLGLLTLTSLVAGNMIGSGVFILPADLARIGSVSLLSWGFTALGAFLLALVFSKMGSLIPKTGGPYAYVEAGFGEYLGFQTAFTYWVAVWIGNCGVTVALMGYLMVFIPQLSNQYIETCVAISTIWLLTMINLKGVATVGKVQFITTILKLLPLLAVAIFGWFYFHPEYITNNFNVTGGSNLKAFSHASTLTLWAFIGVESATVPAGSVENPSRNIPLATLFGTLIAMILYVASSTAIMGMVPAEVLANSASPFASAAKVIFGQWGSWIIAAGAIISSFGGLNGWILIQGQIAMAASDDKLFPKIFSKRNKAGVPYWSLIITSVLMSILLLSTSNPNLVNQFQLIILIAASATLVIYFYSAISQIIILCKMNYQLKPKDIGHIVIALLGASYAFWAFLGGGKDIVFYVMILLFCSLPLYAITAWQRKNYKLQQP